MNCERNTIWQRVAAQLQYIDNQETKLTQLLVAQFHTIFLIAGKWLTLKS